MRRVVAPEIAVVLVVMGDADQRRGRPAPDAAVLPAGMPGHAGDLVVDLVREQHRGRRRHQEMRDQPIGLQEQIIDQPVAVVRPDHRRHRHMVPAVHAAIQASRVDQPVKPVEPRIEHDERQHERQRRPGDPSSGRSPSRTRRKANARCRTSRRSRPARQGSGRGRAGSARRCFARLDLGRGDPAVQPVHDEAAQQVGRGQDRVDRGNGQRQRYQPLRHQRDRPPGAARKRAPCHPSEPAIFFNRRRRARLQAARSTALPAATRAGMTQIAFGSSMRRTMLSLM